MLILGDTGLVNEKEMCYTGFKEQGESLLEGFKWGHSFLSLNRYNNCVIIA